MVQIISDVNSFLLDDFITNGAEQLLVLLNSSQDQIVTTEESSYLRNYILTDCEGVYIESGLKNSVSVLIAGCFVIGYYQNLIYKSLKKNSCCISCYSLTNIMRTGVQKVFILLFRR